MMRNSHTYWALIAAALLAACAGCTRAPGYPQESDEVLRPDKQLDFHVLYQQNCSGCHGTNGRGGAAIPLNNPAYLAIAGAQNLRTTMANGITGTMMPPFATSAGGMLTDQQVDTLVQGILREWGRPSEFSSVALPSYSASTPGNPADGQKAYLAACARCHGSDGTGIKNPNSATNGQEVIVPHSIVDPSYLALVNDQNLRSYIVAGHLDDNAPDWRSYIAGRALTSQEIADIVAWLATHRAPVAEQSVNHPPSGPSTVANQGVAKPAVAKSGPATKESQ